MFLAPQIHSKLITIFFGAFIAWKKGFYSISSRAHFLSQAGAPGAVPSPAPGSSPSCGAGGISALGCPCFLFLDGWGIKPGDAQNQCLFGLFHPFFCPALFGLEGGILWGFHNFTIRVISLQGWGPRGRGPLPLLAPGALVVPLAFPGLGSPLSVVESGVAFGASPGGVAC